MFQFSLFKRTGWLQGHEPKLKIVGEGVEFYPFSLVLMKLVNRQVKASSLCEAGVGCGRLKWGVQGRGISELRDK
jgi:hypothetical protein